jgi:hypothetical protein
VLLNQSVVKEGSLILERRMGGLLSQYDIMAMRKIPAQTGISAQLKTAVMACDSA